MGVLAPAKLNLDLLVGPRREDGFHPLDSIVVQVTLCDEIALAARDDGRIVLSCDAADCGPAEENLAFRAAALLAEQAEQADASGADISLAKGIPPGKGLGGGSSDAAAVLYALNDLWRLELPPRRLVELAAQLGSDVPLFLGPPAARMTGRGEAIEPAAVHDFAAVLHMPDFACATADVYRAFDAAPDAGRAMAPRAAMDLAGSPPSAWREALRNDLTSAAKTVAPELARTMDVLSEACGARVCLTGSGSAMFCLADTVADARAIARRLPPDLPGRTVIVRPIPR
jgi:4-diphosphocytidyl-2-C-methyl-D-erythritol kinase